MAGDALTSHEALTAQGKLPIRRSPVRFAVGPPNGLTSNAWKIWTLKNDVYIACRDNFRETKVSLHASGRWRMGFTSEAVAKNAELVAAGENRAWEVWDEPPAAGYGCVVAFHLYFLGSELAVRPEQRVPNDWKDVLHIEGPPPGRMTAVTLFIAEADVILESNAGPSFRLAALRLKNGRWPQLVAHAQGENDFPELVERAAAASIQLAQSKGVGPTPAEAYGYFFGHDNGTGARFIIGGRLNR